MKFVGKGMLLNRHYYESADKQSGVMMPHYRYEFLVGDKNENGFIPDATVEVTTADHELLTGKEKFMDSINIELEVKLVWEKDANGKNRQVRKPVYTVSDLNGVK